jgi:hypothetical protein
VSLSRLFKWYGADFVAKYSPKKGFEGHGDVERAVLNFISGYLVDADKKFLEDGKYSIDYLPYDWSLNEQKEQ